MSQENLGKHVLLYFRWFPNSFETSVHVYRSKPNDYVHLPQKISNWYLLVQIVWLHVLTSILLFFRMVHYTKKYTVISIFK